MYVHVNDRRATPGSGRRVCTSTVGGYNEVLELMRDKLNKPIHAVRRCLTTSCVRLWHRDVNACCSIFDLFSHQNSSQGQRSKKFTRTYQRNALRIP